MCGIFFSLSNTQHILPDHDIAERLRNRGPDSRGTVSANFKVPTKYDAPNENVYGTLYSTVLSLRGSQTTIQPYQDSNEKFTLCWNGEAWTIDGHRPSGNDTEAVYKLLTDALDTSCNPEVLLDPFKSGFKVSSALSRVAGPYAFVLFDHERGRTYFGRDFLGRRSLLKRTTNDGDLIMCSVSEGNTAAGWTEVEPDGIYCLDPCLNEETVFHPDLRIQKLGKFAAGLIQYNFAEHPGIADSPSVIPRLSLNKVLPSVRQPLIDRSMSVAKVEELLRDSLRSRVLSIPDPPSTQIPCETHIEQAKLAVLFSGGLDCTVLARLSHEILPLTEPIDLLNVAFENPRIHNRKDHGTNEENTAYEVCPDRMTGRASCAELQSICPGRRWRFVAIDVPYSEMQAHRETVISLMHPHNTEMDLSICNALFFAARGEGNIFESSANGPRPFTTSARVLLSGLGADELFAGYTRHGTAFKRHGLPGLLDELELDVARLGKRNLGRDDRAMSHWSKEVRFPYLDEKLVSWALDSPVTDKCGFGEPSSDSAALLSEDGSAALEPGKKVLRCLAWKLGMRGVAKEKKRAIQFGARTAKMETGRTKGTQLLS